MSRLITLGVLVPFYGDIYFSDLVTLIHHFVQRRGARLVVIRTGSNKGDFDLPIASDYVDGWILVLNPIVQSYLDQLIAMGKPIASIAHDFNNPHIVSVESDN